MKKEIKITSDGSHTLYVPELDEHYHSIHGAIQESQHVFINNGIHSLFKSPIKVLEVGFGTGLNALLTALWSLEENTSVDYTGVEAFPIDLKMNQALNYPKELDGDNIQEFFNKMILSKWDVISNIHPLFSLRKIESRIEDFSNDIKFDIIYFDAFGPDTQQELWKEDLLDECMVC